MVRSCKASGAVSKLMLDPVVVQRLCGGTGARESNLALACSYIRAVWIAYNWKICLGGWVTLPAALAA